MRKYIVYSENPVDRKIFAEQQMCVVSRSMYISQFPDVMTQKGFAREYAKGGGGRGSEQEEMQK